MRARMDQQLGRSNASSGATPEIEVFDVLGPIQAGIRARSIVETCDALALPSVFLDRTGRVLHVGRWAAPFMGSALRIAADHLVGQSERINRDIQTLLNAALAAPTAKDSSPVAVIETDDGGGSITITAHRCEDSSPYQLLNTILVFGRDKMSVATA